MKIIASNNGFKAAQATFESLKQGASPLDVCVDSCTIVEDDLDEITVGSGGMPNEDGVVELDAAVMDGPTHRAGAVAAMRDIANPAQVARLVLQRTDRVMLAGEGAQKFALEHGFQKANLLSERARKMWLYWKQMRSGRYDLLPPSDDQRDLDVEAYLKRTFDRPHGTVHFGAINSAGDLACATSTSGHPFKLAGRVGDSPIVGAGLYVDNEAGTCGSIGHGEANMQNLSSFAAVQLMRSGMAPLDAGLQTLRDVVRHGALRNRDEQGRVQFDLRLFLLAKDGRHAGVSIWGGKQMTVVDEQGARHEDCTPLYEGERPQ